MANKKETLVRVPAGSLRGFTEHEGYTEIRLGCTVDDVRVFDREGWFSVSAGESVVGARLYRVVKEIIGKEISGSIQTRSGLKAALRRAGQGASPPPSPPNDARLERADVDARTINVERG